jgi:hypothetical protein
MATGFTKGEVTFYHLANGQSGRSLVLCPRHHKRYGWRGLHPGLVRPLWWGGSQRLCWVSLT